MALAVVSLVAAAAFAPRHRTTPSATSGDAPYAYMTSDSITVARGSHVAATAGGLFGEAGGLMATLDGRYVAAISEQEAVPAAASLGVAAEANNRVVSIDVETGAVATYPCDGCTGLMAAGGSMVVISIDGQYDGVSVLLLDLAAHTAPHRLSTNLVPLASGPNLIAGLPGEVFLDGGNVYETTDSLGPLQAFVLHLNGKAASIPAIDSNVGVLSSAWTVRDEHGRPALALAGASKPTPNDTCAIGGFVALVDPVSGDVTMTNTSAIVPESDLIGAAANGRTSLSVQDLWWSTDGHLHATIATWQCQPNKQDFLQAKPATEWRLDDGRWQRVSGTPVDNVRELGGGQAAQLVAGPDSGPIFSVGTLYFVDGSRRVAVAHEVTELIAPGNGRSG